MSNGTSPYQAGHWYKFYKYAPVPVTIGTLQRNVSPYIWYGRCVAVYGDYVVLDNVTFKGGFNLADLDFDQEFHLNTGEALKQCPPGKQVVLYAAMYEFAGEIPGPPS